VLPAGKSTLYDSVIYKVCGATRRDILAILVAEFSLAGLFTGLGSLALGTLTAKSATPAMTWKIRTVRVKIRAALSSTSRMVITATSGKACVARA